MIKWISLQGWLKIYKFKKRKRTALSLQEAANKEPVLSWDFVFLCHMPCSEGIQRIQDTEGDL
jgi:hypothetical protein